MQNIKVMEEYLDNPIWTDEPFCQCEKKIICKSSDFTHNIIYCELCDCPILAKDMNKVIR